jgi:drug/metabolite transporter (DMT)-like permease
MFGMTEGLDKWNTWIGAVIVILGLAVVTWQHHRQLAQQKQKEEVCSSSSISIAILTLES